MSDYEDIVTDAKREAWEDRYGVGSKVYPDETCGTCGRDDRWSLAEMTVYGDDADGNRGRPLYVFGCECGNECEVLAYVGIVVAAVWAWVSRPVNAPPPVPVYRIRGAVPPPPPPAPPPRHRLPSHRP